MGTIVERLMVLAKSAPPVAVKAALVAAAAAAAAASRYNQSSNGVVLLLAAPGGEGHWIPSQTPECVVEARTCNRSSSSSSGSLTVQASCVGPVSVAACKAWGSHSVG
jgi:hypothetical protein